MDAAYERTLWEEEFRERRRPAPFLLFEYVTKKKDTTWRSTRNVEMLCAYALAMKDTCELLEKHIMTNQDVKCAQCGKVIGKEPLNPEEVAKHYFGDDENKCENTATKRFTEMFEAWKNRDENKQSKVCPKCGMQRVQDGMCWELTCSYREPDNE